MSRSIGWIVAGIAWTLLGVETGDPAPWALAAGVTAWAIITTIRST